MRVNSGLQLLHFLSLLILITMSACGRPQERSHEDGPHYVTGPLQQHVGRILTDEFAEDCDRRHGEKLQEIARALDERKAEIDTLSRNQPPSRLYRKVTLGPTYVRELITPVTAAVGWQEYTKDWAELIDYYQRILTSPTDASWVWLNSSVRGILYDDADRVNSRANLYLDKDSAPLLASVQQAIFTCRADSTCTRPDLSPELTAFVSSNKIFNWYWTRLSGSNARSILERFYNRVSYDYRRYEFRNNPTITQNRSREIILPLDLGVFAEAQDQFASYIEGLWSSRDLKVKIRPATPSSIPELFRVLLEQNPGDRAFVSFTNRVVQLFPDVRTRSIAHEIGHVLGFKDRYYTIWEPAHCRYRVQYNPEDLMSDSDSGFVLPDEWQTLKAQYPVR